jgi:hypothetical protein
MTLTPFLARLCARQDPEIPPPTTRQSTDDSVAESVVVVAVAERAAVGGVLWIGANALAFAVSSTATSIDLLKRPMVDVDVLVGE